jgi:hypothetical protein
MSPLLDQKLDLSFLLETGWLLSVCFGKYTVILKFPRLTISISSTCEVTSIDKTVRVCDPERQPGDLTMFTVLLESEISCYRVTQRPELILSFSNGCELSLIDHQDGYESFVITTDQGTFLAV